MTSQVKFEEATLGKLNDVDAIMGEIIILAVSIVTFAISYDGVLTNDENIAKYIRKLQETLVRAYYGFNLLERRLYESIHERVRTIRASIGKALGILEEERKNFSVEDRLNLNKEILDELIKIFVFLVCVPKDSQQTPKNVKKAAMPKQKDKVLNDVSDLSA